MINSLKRFRRCFAKIAFFGVLSSLIPVIPVYASVVVTPATGGSTISADTNGATGTGVYTLLTGPTITEGAVGDVHAGTIILNAPTGFAFDTGGVAPTVLIGCVTGSCTTSNRNVNGVVMTNGITADSPSAITSRTASTITFTVTSAGSNGVKNYLTWQNVRVRPTAGSPLAPSGNITKGGTAIVTGATALTNFGTLGEGPGSTNLKLAITIQPSLIALNGIDFAVKPVVALQDQFGNT